MPDFSLPREERLRSLTTIRRLFTEGKGGFVYPFRYTYLVQKPKAVVTDVEAEVAEETEKKIYMFVGDSITHSDEYRAHTEAFFMTRFPDKKAEFVNELDSSVPKSSIINKSQL